MLKEQEVDALLVAGDVFDSMHPSAEARTVYYRFLSRVAQSGVRDVVVVGGNHDSPSNLNAPKEILEVLGVHVVGGIPDADNRLDPMIVPFRARGSEEPSALCLAVPYVHEYRLGIRTSDLDRKKTRSAFKAAFTDLYRDLADRAVERFGDLPLVATGHLTLGSRVSSKDYMREIHQVGTIDGLPVEILDPRIRYAALGHIHRCYSIKGSAAWYSGTPIPYSLTEMEEARQVLVVDLDDEGAVSVKPVEVPRLRDIVLLEGSPDEVLAGIGSLTVTTPLPPLVHVRVRTDTANPGLTRRIHEVLSDHAEQIRPVLVDLKKLAINEEAGPEETNFPRLEELEPRGVFGRICDAKGISGEDRRQLEAAFGQIESLSPEAFQEMLESIELHPAAKDEEVP